MNSRLNSNLNRLPILMIALSLDFCAIFKFIRDVSANSSLELAILSLASNIDLALITTPLLALGIINDQDTCSLMKNFEYFPQYLTLDHPLWMLSRVIGYQAPITLMSKRIL
jgi:hypothetical protein